MLLQRYIIANNYEKAIKKKKKRERKKEDGGFECSLHFDFVSGYFLFFSLSGPV